ncbi:MAG: thioredoxin family protein [Thermoanaerobaculia bacterium]
MFLTGKAPVRRRIAALSVLLAAAIPTAIAAQFAEDGATDEAHKATLAIHADRTSYAAGEEIRLAAIVEVESGWHLQAHVPTYDYLIPTILSFELPEGWVPPAVDYPEPHPWKFAFAEDRLDVYQGRLRVLARLQSPADTAPGTVRLAGTLRYQACDDRQCLPPTTAEAEVEIEIGSSGSAANAASFADFVPSETPAAPPSAPATDAPVSHWGILLLALLGGLILNGMPCVLPILSLKLFGLVKASGQSRHAVRAGALATTAGILVSFWALAGAAILAKQAGAAIGWGVQFQQPGFVAFLTVVVLLFSLNLWGLFEIPLPARLATLGDSAASGDHLGGHFASGLFSTLMATPCSAPFLGTALSFALGQSGGVIFAVLTAVGAGLALPYLLLVAAPGAARLLPRPGAWMDTLRGALGFLLAGAVVWLLFVLGGQVDPVRLALFEVGLLALSLCVWLRHRIAARGGRTAIAWLLVAAAAVGLVLYAARSPRAARLDGGSAAAESANALPWIPFDRGEAERLAGEGRLVFLDITADWCVTCKVNERVILHTPEVAAAFREHEVLAMKADWTNRDDEIARFLADHGRYGIPFYMLYRPGKPPHVFGELIGRQEIVRVIADSAAD